MARNRRPRIYDQELSVREGEPVAAQVFAYDRDAGDTLTYRIVSGNGDGLFQIDPLTGVITRADGGVFDFETDARRYDLRVRVTDDGNPPKSRTADVTIRITDAPDAPHEITVANLSVDENAAGAVIGAVTVADQDDTSHILTVDDARFEIVGGVLKLKGGESLDHEAEATVDVTITATDDDDGSLSQSFTIAVTDVNEAPSGLSLSGAAVDENAVGAVVGLITVSDPDDPLDPFGMHSFSVDDSRFEIVGGVLKLKDGEALDHEAGGLVSVTVTATDGGGLSTSETFDIAVTDLNDAPTAIALSETSVDENALGAVVGTVTITDQDDPGHPFGQHTITVDDARFEVLGNTLKLVDGVSLDHEATGPVPVTVTATDGGGAAISQTFDIAVADVNEAPTAMTLSNATVDEATARAVVGTLTVTDPDDPLQPFGRHSFTVDDSRFEVVGNVLRVKSGVTLDHETEDMVTVTVTATDGGGASVTQMFDLAVTDVNEAPTAVNLSNLRVDEATPGAVIGDIIVSDPDDPSGAFGMHTVTVNDSRFEIVDGALKLKDGVALDFADGSYLLVTLTATDGGGLSASHVRPIYVNEINEAPVLTFNGVDSLPEEAVGLLVGTGYATDPDRADGIFGLTTLTVDDPRFEFFFGRLQLKNDAALDFETEPTVTLTITATDPGGLTDSQTFTFDVRDVLDGKTFFSLGALDGTDGSILFSSDPDDFFEFGYSVSGAGDVNGDGYDDLVVGVPIASAGPEAVDQGASYVVFGSAAGFPAHFDLATIDGSNGFRISGTDTNYGGLGASVSGAGDFNNDGFADLVVSAIPIAAPAGTGWPPPPPPTNESFVIYGKADGWTADFDLETLDPADGFRLFSSTAGDYIGSPTLDIGDFNGDGFDDFAISDPGAEIGAYPQGVTYIVFGTDAGMPTDLDLATLDGTNGFRVEGPGPDGFAGYVGFAGDLNGDGFDDFSINAIDYSDPSGFPDHSDYVVYGTADAMAPTVDLGALGPTEALKISSDNSSSLLVPNQILTAGDFNGDGHEDIAVSAADWPPDSGAVYVVYGDAAGLPDTIDLASLDGTAGFRIDGPADAVFGYNATTAGDVNGDGIDDLLIASEKSNEVGSVYLVYGQEGGYAQGLDLSQFDGTAGFRLDGTLRLSGAGFSLDAAGDVNGDGLADIILSEPFESDPGFLAPGAAFVFYGSDITGDISTMGGAGDDMLAGTTAADSLVGAQGDDVLVGNGGADVLYGGAGDDILAVGDLDFSRIDGGGGADTLQIDGSGLALDLTSLGNEVIRGIERVDLTGSGDNALTLAVTDVLAISDESNDLFVGGDAGDQVTAVGAWQSEGPVTVDGVSYTVYSVAGVAAALYVEDDVVFATAATTGV